MIDFVAYLLSTIIFWVVLSLTYGPRRHSWHEVSSVDIATAHRRLRGRPQNGRNGTS